MSGTVQAQVFKIMPWMFMFIMIWARATLLRMRYDHFMKLGWKVLIPVALTWLVLVMFIQGIAAFTEISRNTLLIGIAGIFAIAMILLWIFGGDDDGDETAEEPSDFVRPEDEFDAFAGGFPVPPLPGQTLPPSPRATRRDVETHEEVDLV